MISGLCALQVVQGTALAVADSLCVRGRGAGANTCIDDTVAGATSFMIAPHEADHGATRGALVPGGHKFGITTADHDRRTHGFRLALRQSHQQTFGVNLSCSGKASLERASKLRAENKGSAVFPSMIVTKDSDKGSQAEIALKGNHSDLLNPSTNTDIDLPEEAEATVQIIGILGWQVSTIPAHELKAGAKRTVEADASSLASGAFLFRAFAVSAPGRNIEAGRVVRVK